MNKYTTKIYDSNVDIEKIHIDLEKEFDKKLSVELRIRNSN